MCRHRLLTVLCVFAINCCISQRNQAYSLQHFTGENGLPQNSVKSIIRDEKGFIWFTTEDGLMRFDGASFMRFSKDNLPVSSNRFLLIYSGTDGKGLFTSSERHEQVRIQNGMATADSTGRFITNWQKKYPDDTWEKGVSHSMILPSLTRQHSSIRKNILHTPGQNFVCTRDSVVVYGSAQQRLDGYGFRPASLWDFFTIDQQLYYLHPDGDVHTFSGARKKIRLQGDILDDPLYTKKQQLPILVFWNSHVSNRVLFYFNQCFYLVKRAADGSLYTKLLLQGVDTGPMELCTAFYDEQDGTIYMGSYTKGLYVFSPQPFRTYTAGQGDDVYYAQTVYEHNTILTTQGNVFDLSQKTAIIGALKKIVTPDFYSISIDKAGDTWTKRDNTLYKLEKGSFRILGSWVMPRAITVLYPGADGKLWIGVRNEGLYVMDISKQGAAPTLFAPSPRDISYIQQEGNTLWAGTGKGLYRLHLGEKNVDTIRELQTDYIRSLYLSAPGQLWISTSERGFFLYQQQKLTSFPLDNQKRLAGPHCIMEDRNGYFWITTNKGLFQAAKADLLRYAAGEQGQLFYLYYDKSSGFNTNEFNGGCQPCALQLNNGYFSFPSLNGLVIFHPDSIPLPLPAADLFIDEVMLDKHSIAYQQTLSLPRDFEQLTFRVSTPYSGNKENVQVMYTLMHESKEPLWLPLSADGLISFSAIPPGQHTLLIRKANGFGVNNYTEKKITLLVPIPWYQASWFYAVCFLLTGLFIVVFIRLRLRYIRQKNKVLEEKIAEKTKELLRRNYIQEKIIRSVSHDIRTPLKYQLLLSKSIYEGLKKENNSAYIGSTKIQSDYTHELYHMVDNLLKYLKAQINNGQQASVVVELEPLVQEKINIFREIALDKGTSIVTNVAKGLTVKTDQQLLSVILHNLMDNAVKVTSKGTIAITAEQHGEKAIITLSDTGPGLSKALQDWVNKGQIIVKRKDDTEQSGIGLLMVKELAGLAGIQLSVSAEPGKGTNYVLVC